MKFGRTLTVVVIGVVYLIATGGFGTATLAALVLLAVFLAGSFWDPEVPWRRR